MLHTPPAQRGADRPRLRIRRIRRKHPALSATLGDLPRGRVIEYREINPDHCLAVVSTRAYYGQVAYAHAFGGPQWICDRLFHVCGVVSPAVDLAAYRQTRIWQDEQPLGIEAVSMLEEFAREEGSGLVTPYCHDWLTPEQVAELQSGRLF